MGGQGSNQNVPLVRLVKIMCSISEETSYSHGIYCKRLIPNFSTISDQEETETFGGANKLVFLHGWIQSSDHCWLSAARKICQKYGYEAVLIDFPGHGKSEFPEFPVVTLT